MSDREPIRVLLTGFGPFPGVRTNLSGDFLAQFETHFSPVADNVEVRTEIVDTSWTAAEEFVANNLAVYDPHIALHFGVHRRADGFRIETRARNRAGAHADVDGKVFGRAQLVSNTPPILRSNVPAAKLVQSLQSHGLPANPSQDAGRYLCNMLLYLSLLQSSESGRLRQTGFIHIPQFAGPSHHKTGARRSHFDMTTLLDGTKIIVNQCIVEHRRMVQTDGGDG